MYKSLKSVARNYLYFINLTLIIVPTILIVIMMFKGNNR